MKQDDQLAEGALEPALRAERTASGGLEDLSSGHVESVCPVCGAALISEKCKVVCRSALCGYRIILNCSEF